jgi:hypothetical protein
MYRALLFLFLSLPIIFTSCSKETMEWNRIKDSSDLSPFREYVSAYPNSKYVELAKERIEGLMWRETTKQNSLQAYYGYLTENPHGKFRSQCENRINEITKSIYSIWRMTEASSYSMIGIQPKTNEFLILCSSGEVDIYLSGIHYMLSEFSTNRDTLLIKRIGKPLLFNVTSEQLKLSSPAGGYFEYDRLTGYAKEEFIAGCFAKPRCTE